MGNYIERTENGYTVYTLSNQGTELEVIPQRGGIVSGLRFGGSRILYMDRGTLYDSSKNVRGGIPILFPICGYLADNTYTLGEVTYHMKQHGFARNYPHDVTDISTSESETSITVVFSDNPETYEEYPFHFQLKNKYSISSNSLIIDTEIKNNDAKTMPFYLGFHPYFKVSDKNILAVEVPYGKYIEKIPGSIINGGLNFDADEVNVSYYDLNGNICKLLNAQEDLNIELSFDDSFKYVTLWSLKGSDFVCLEPWMAYVDSMNTGKDLNFLEPGTVHRSRVTISVGNA